MSDRKTISGTIRGEKVAVPVDAQRRRRGQKLAQRVSAGLTVDLRSERWRRGTFSVGTTFIMVFMYPTTAPMMARNNGSYKKAECRASGALLLPYLFSAVAEIASGLSASQSLIY